MFERGSIPVLENVVHFTTARHRAILSNIANVNTPSYKAIDVPEEEFRKALLDAIEESRERPVPTFDFQGTNRIRPKAGGGLEIDFVEATDVGILTHSENNVDIDKQMALMVENTQMHNMAATLLAQQFNMLRMAISGRIA